jgi:hypothetical protein
MLTVYKYPIAGADEFTLSLPVGAQLLSVQMQNGQPCLWALVDPDTRPVNRKFRLAGTGHPIEQSNVELKYVSTFQANGGALVFHVFEILDNLIGGMR